MLNVWSHFSSRRCAAPRSPWSDLRLPEARQATTWTLRKVLPDKRVDAEDAVRLIALVAVTQSIDIVGSVLLYREYSVSN